MGSMNSGEYPSAAGSLIEPQKLLDARRLVTDTMVGLVRQPSILDAALIGNASALYVWEPCLLIDIDICIFVDEMGDAAGCLLLDHTRRLDAILKSHGMDFELKIIRGPYKPYVAELRRPFVFAHLAVFTEELYRAEAVFLRWGWRKYPCVRETGRLARLAPTKPTITDLLYTKRGLLERLHSIEAGMVSMDEWLLPSLRVEERIYSGIQSTFVEYCLASAANVARNHARALGREEADRLGNRDFFEWYDGELFPSAALQELMAMKADARLSGYADMMPKVRDLAIEYLGSLANYLDA